MRQHRIDSVLEAVVNQGVGFLVALATYQWIINPLFGFNSDMGESALVTSIFMLTSIIRSYIIRRLFDGKTVYEGLRAKFNKERPHVQQ